MKWKNKKNIRRNYVKGSEEENRISTLTRMSIDSEGRSLPKLKGTFLGVRKEEYCTRIRAWCEEEGGEVRGYL